MMATGSFSMLVVCFIFVSMDTTQAVRWKKVFFLLENQLDVLGRKTNANDEQIIQNWDAIVQLNKTVMELERKCLSREHDEDVKKTDKTAGSEDGSDFTYRLSRVADQNTQTTLHVRDPVKQMSNAIIELKAGLLKIDASNLALNQSTEKVTSELNDLRKEVNTALSAIGQEQRNEIDALRQSLETVTAELSDLKSLLNGSIPDRYTDSDKANQPHNSEPAIKPGRAIQCPQSWSKHGHSCYKFHIDKVNYEDAKRQCSSYGGHVVDIADMDEMKFVISLVGMDIQFWLGLTFSQVQWKWERTGARTTFTNWRVGQPDGGSQRCAIAGYQAPYDQWNDIECNDVLASRFHVVCKI